MLSTTIPIGANYVTTESGWKRTMFGINFSVIKSESKTFEEKQTEEANTDNQQAI